MLVEIGLIQRLSLFLGHPVYGLAVGLFAVILSTGVGSLISDRLPLSSPRRLVLWSGALTFYLGALPFWLPLFVGVFEASPIVIRAAAAVLMVAPLGLLMGFDFPTGMALVNALDTRPTPWFLGDQWRSRRARSKHRGRSQYRLFDQHQHLAQRPLLPARRCGGTRFGEGLTRCVRCRGGRGLKHLADTSAVPVNVRFGDWPPGCLQTSAR